MKLLLAISTLLAASATAKYAPGQDCRTNKGCDQNCFQSKWSVVIEAGDVRMVCDPSNLDSTRYAAAKCLGKNKDRKDAPETKSVCDNQKGHFCGDTCFLTTKASQEEASTSSFKTECEKHKQGVLDPDGDPFTYTPIYRVFPTKEQALEYHSGNCAASDVFP